MDPNGPSTPIETAEPEERGYREHRVPRGPHHLYARDHPGAEPAIVLLHGFPMTCTCTTGSSPTWPAAGS